MGAYRAALTGGGLAAQRLDDQARTTPTVPNWFACELVNILFQRVRGGNLTLNDAIVSLIDALSIVTLREADYPAVSSRALSLAHQLGQRASYDAHHLALAEHLGCELWTADERFWRAVGPTFPHVKWVGNVTIPAAPPTPPPTT